jgi:hypothetical protein
MMTETLCNYPDRDEYLVAYLYDDINSAEQTAFGSHLSGCRHCQQDLLALRGVRSALGTWAPPDPVFSNRESRVASPASRVRSPEARAASREPRAASWWREMPAWAQVAAALFVLGVSATIANLDVRYDRSGLTIRTGWSQPRPAAQVPANAAPWRAELTALESELRSEMKASQVAAAAVSAPAAQAVVSDADFRRRVRALLDESEKKQQNELALRLVQFQTDISAQRQADLRTINQNLGFIQRDTYGELLKQREGMNYLLKVSQKQ